MCNDWCTLVLGMFRCHACFHHVIHFLSGMHFTTTFTSSKNYIGHHPLSFFWELVSGELDVHAEHIQCHKHDIRMEIDPYGRSPFLSHPMSMATAFILSLFVNSLLFIIGPIISSVAMVPGDMEGIQPVLRSSPIFSL